MVGIGICIYVLSHADSDDRQQTATDEHSQRHADRHHDQYSCTGENINFNSHFVYRYQKPASHEIGTNSDVNIEIRFNLKQMSA